MQHPCTRTPPHTARAYAVSMCCVCAAHAKCMRACGPLAAQRPTAGPPPNATTCCTCPAGGHGCVPAAPRPSLLCGEARVPAPCASAGSAVRRAGKWPGSPQAHRRPLRPACVWHRLQGAASSARAGHALCAHVGVCVTNNTHTCTPRAPRPQASGLPPPPEVPPPADPQLKREIDGLAALVARSGPAVEALARKQAAAEAAAAAAPGAPPQQQQGAGEAGGPGGDAGGAGAGAAAGAGAGGRVKFGFLLGGESAQYYAWRLSRIRWVINGFLSYVLMTSSFQAHSKQHAIHCLVHLHMNAGARWLL